MATQIRAILADKGDTVHTIDRHEALTRAAERMKRLKVAALVVTHNGEVDGLITERDVMLAVSDRADTLTSLSVRDVMDRSPETCSTDDPILRVMERMTQLRRRHVPVVDGQRLCGIVSIGDMVKYRLDQMELETRVMREIYIAGH
jgi:CBS domain-containing protein